MPRGRPRKKFTNAEMPAITPIAIIKPSNEYKTHVVIHFKQVFLQNIIVKAVDKKSASEEILKRLENGEFDSEITKIINKQTSKGKNMKALTDKIIISQPFNN